MLLYLISIHQHAKCYKNKICHYIAINSSKYHVQHGGHTINDECEERERKKKVEQQQQQKDNEQHTHGSTFKTIKLKPTNQPRNLFSRERENIFYFVVGNILFFLFLLLHIPFGVEYTIQRGRVTTQYKSTYMTI